MKKYETTKYCSNSMSNSPRNCIRSSEKYWATNPFELFSHLNFFPNGSMSLEGKLNSLMRLALIIFLILLAFHYRFSVAFLILTVIINIAFYFAYRKQYE